MLKVASTGNARGVKKKTYFFYVFVLLFLTFLFPLLFLIFGSLDDLVIFQQVLVVPCDPFHLSYFWL